MSDKRRTKSLRAVLVSAALIGSSLGHPHCAAIAAERYSDLPLHREGNRLIFEGARLSAVLAEFNVCNLTPKFRIRDVEVGQRRITGVLNVDAPDSFVRVLLGLGDLSIEISADEVIVGLKPMYL